MEAVVKNQGTTDTDNGFYTDLYVDHVPTGAGDISGSIQFWINDPIPPGATVTLTTVISDPSALGGVVGQEVGAAAESSHTLYTQVDSVGGVGENNEANNVYSAGTEVCLASADGYEPDNSAVAATALSLGTSQTHNLSTLTDEDWLKVQLSAGISYTIKTSDLGVSGDTYLYLYDSDGTTLLVANDDYGGTLASRIDWVPPSTGQYYVAVKHWNPNAAGCGTSYDVSLEEGEAGAAPLTWSYFPVIMKE